jgi:WD40 repeat protein
LKGEVAGKMLTSLVPVPAGRPDARCDRSAVEADWGRIMFGLRVGFRFGLAVTVFAGVALASWRGGWSPAREDTTGSAEIIFGSTNVPELEKFSAVATDPGGRWLAFGTRGGTLRVLAADGTGVERAWQAHADSAVNAISFLPDSSGLVSVRWDGDLRLWALTDGGAVLRAAATARGTVLSAAVSPDGTTLALGGVGTIALWRIEAERLSPKIELETASGSHVTALAFSPDGRVLVSAGSNGDTSVLLWHLEEAGGPIEVECGTSCYKRGLGFSPDGRVLNVLDSDGALARVNLDDGRRITAQISVPPCRQGVFTADGRRVLIAHYCGVARWGPVPVGDPSR